MKSSENKEQIKVMMIAASLPPLPAGGAELQAMRLGEALVQKGVAVSFITPGKGALRGAASLKDMPVFRLNSVFNRLFGWLSALKKQQHRQGPARIEYDDNTEQTNQISSRVGWPTVIYYHIFFYHSLFFLWRRRQSFDIIHAHTMEWSAIVAARLGKALGKPVLIKDSTMNGFASLIRFPAGRRLQQTVIRNAHFVAMTMVIEDNLIKAGIPAARISRIPNGIPITTAALPVSALPVSTLPLPAMTGPPRVLFVGNLYQQPAKGIDILLKAWVRVTAEHPSALLDIVGDGDLAAYREYAGRLGIGATVRFCGRQSDLPPYYRSATVFVLPSRREGMSNALMEAMLHGLPCVATDISGNQDLIRPDFNGLLVAPADVPALAASIGYMLAHPDQALRMGAEARTTILRQSDIRIVADLYISLYNRVLIH